MRIAVILVLLTAIAHATPSQDLAAANKAFRAGEYVAARDKYNALLYPELQLANPDELVEAYVNLGVCRLATGDEGGAKREFEKALGIDPNRQIDPLVVTNKKAIELFDDTKIEIRTRAEREAAKKREAEEAEKLRKLRESLIGVRDNPRYLTFIPPLGQFQNGDTAKGIFLLGGQVATGATSLAIWGYLVNKYGIRSTTVPTEDAASVLRLQRIEVGTGIAFIGLYIIGVIDANLNYKRQVRTELDESQLPPELREQLRPKPRPKQTSLLERIHVTPILTPDSAGIGIGWEN